MSLIKAKELREKRAKVLGQMKDLHKKNKGTLAKEDEKRWSKLDKRSEDLLKQAQRHERMSELESKDKDTRQMKIDEGGQPDKEQEEAEKRSKQYQASFKRFATQKRGTVLSDEDYKTLRAGEARSQTVGTQSEGGYLVPTGFANEIEKNMKYYGGMLETARVRQTETGNPIPFPTVDDTNNKGAIISETTADTEQPIVYGSKNIKAYTYTSKLILVSWELIQDAFNDLQSDISEMAGERIGRIINEHFTLGTGTDQPLGVMTGATLGKTAASATAISRGEIVDLIHSVNRAYRRGPNVKLMFNDLTLAAIKKLSFGSGDDRPLWQPGITVGEPDRLEGYSYVVNDDIASIGAGAKTMLFGDFSKYLIRQAKGIELVVANERYVEKRSTGFFAYARFDANIMNANAIKYLKQA